MIPSASLDASHGHRAGTIATGDSTHHEKTLEPGTAHPPTSVAGAVKGRSSRGNHMRTTTYAVASAALALVTTSAVAGPAAAEPTEVFHGIWNTVQISGQTQAIVGHWSATTISKDRLVFRHVLFEPTDVGNREWMHHASWGAPLELASPGAGEVFHAVDSSGATYVLAEDGTLTFTLPAGYDMVVQGSLGN